MSAKLLIDPWSLGTIEPSPLCTFARGNKGQIAYWVRQAFETCYPGDEDKGSCLYWTWAGCQILRRCGYRAILQAGSASWPIQPDRGWNPTHFSYMWQPDSPDSVEAIRAGNMPEVHIWIALPDEGEIVDFSTAHLKTICEERYALRWELPDPPEYLWCKPHELPDKWIYRAHLSAIRFVLEKLAKDLQRQ